MKIGVEAALFYLLGFILAQQGLCDEVFNTSGASNWTCTCFSSRNNNNVSASNCSPSCNCTPDGEQWKCVCPANAFPTVDTSGTNATCFSTCKCTAGLLVQSPKKRFSGNTAMLILLICVIVTTLVFLASLICYVYRKNKFSVERPLFSSDRESSWNSSANLISRKASLSETETNIGSSVTGCFRKASFFCQAKTETIHGMIIQFSYLELEQATKKFSNSNLIGIGGSSCVYRGKLRDGTTVAIKRLTAPEGPDSDSVFSTEVELISRLHHFHVVPLLGYCSEFRGKNAERLLVFEYMTNGSLRDCLDGASAENMTWDVRVSIAIGAARGLEYLHEAAAPRILHRDVKSTNILLDENWRAKITDLGMAQCVRPDGLPSCSNSPVRLHGTFGYFAPEYAIVGRASLMSDVFSFGVVLLELITGRQPIHKSTSKGGESLVIWATPRLQDSKRVISELPDPRLKRNFPEEEMQIMAYLAKECLLLDPDARPTMSEVVQILSTIAPDKSRRRNIPTDLFLMSADQRTKNKACIDKPTGTCIDKPIGKETGTLSSAYIESLILLSSEAKNQCDHDNEPVDLTEPRFESFCVSNIKPSLHEPSSQTQNA